jgi:quercetin dioxygenase-like cupin family protein
MSDEAFLPADLVAYQTNAIVSKQIIKKPAGTVTLFAFDAGESLSEHTAPFDALVEVVEGSAEIKIDGRIFEVPAGRMLLLPANIPHAVNAKQRFKMVLTMVKE